MPAPVCGGEDVAWRSGARARQSVPRTSREQAHQWASRFARLFTQSIYKWVQSPLSLHVGSLDLERERALQMPVVQKTEWTNGDEVGKAGIVDKTGKAGKAGGADRAAKRPDS